MRPTTRAGLATRTAREGQELMRPIKTRGNFLVLAPQGERVAAFAIEADAELFVRAYQSEYPGAGYRIAQTMALEAEDRAAPVDQLNNHGDTRPDRDGQNSGGTG